MTARIIILIFMLTCSSMTFGQSKERKFFTNEISQLSKAVNDKNWTKICDMIYPKVFNLMSKSNVLLMFEQTAIMGIEASSKFKTINEVSEAVKYKNEKYRRINYNAIISITLTGLMSYSQELIAPKLAQEFGAENVKYIDSINTYVIKLKRNIYAIADINNENWHYIDIDSPFLAKNKTLIPFTVQKQLR